MSETYAMSAMEWVVHERPLSPNHILPVRTQQRAFAQHSANIPPKPRAPVYAMKLYGGLGCI
jgi:hypothetical protein